MTNFITGKISAVVIAAFILLAGCTSADKPDNFMEEAAQSGLAEVQLGLIALQRSTSEDVKRFAQQVVDEHGKANAELAELAGRKGIKMPREMDAKHQSLVSTLDSLSGEAFDKEYVNAMVEDHEEDIKEFETQSRVGSDAAIKAFAAKQLPVLQQHLQMIRDIKARMPQ